MLILQDSSDSDSVSTMKRRSSMKSDDAKAADTLADAVGNQGNSASKENKAKSSRPRRRSKRPVRFIEDEEKVTEDKPSHETHSSDANTTEEASPQPTPQPQQPMEVETASKPVEESLEHPTMPQDSITGGDGVVVELPETVPESELESSIEKKQGEAEDLEGMEVSFDEMTAAAAAGSDSEDEEEKQIIVIEDTPLNDSLSILTTKDEKDSASKIKSIEKLADVAEESTVTEENADTKPKRKTRRRSKAANKVAGKGSHEAPKAEEPVGHGKMQPRIDELFASSSQSDSDSVRAYAGSETTEEQGKEEEEEIKAKKGKESPWTGLRSPVQTRSARLKISPTNPKVATSQSKVIQTSNAALAAKKDAKERTLKASSSLDILPSPSKQRPLRWGRSRSFDNDPVTGLRDSKDKEEADSKTPRQVTAAKRRSSLRVSMTTEVVEQSEEEGRKSSIFQEILGAGESKRSEIDSAKKSQKPSFAALFPAGTDKAMDSEGSSVEAKMSTISPCAVIVEDTQQDEMDVKPEQATPITVVTVIEETQEFSPSKLKPQDAAICLDETQMKDEVKEETDVDTTDATPVSKRLFIQPCLFSPMGSCDDVVPSSQSPTGSSGSGGQSVKMTSPSNLDLSVTRLSPVVQIKKLSNLQLVQYDSAVRPSAQPEPETKVDNDSVLLLSESPVGASAAPKDAVDIRDSAQNVCDSAQAVENCDKSSDDIPMTPKKDDVPVAQSGTTDSLPCHNPDMQVKDLDSSTASEADSQATIIAKQPRSRSRRSGKKKVEKETVASKKVAAKSDTDCSGQPQESSHSGEQQADGDLSSQREPPTQAENEVFQPGLAATLSGSEDCSAAMEVTMEIPDGQPDPDIDRPAVTEEQKTNGSQSQDSLADVTISMMLQDSPVVPDTAAQAASASPTELKDKPTGDTQPECNHDDSGEEEDNLPLSQLTHSQQPENAASTSSDDDIPLGQITRTPVPKSGSTGQGEGKDSLGSEVETGSQGEPGTEAATGGEENGGAEKRQKTGKLRVKGKGKKSDQSSVSFVKDTSTVKRLRSSSRGITTRGSGKRSRTDALLHKVQKRSPTGATRWKGTRHLAASAVKQQLVTEDETGQEEGGAEVVRDTKPQGDGETQGDDTEHVTTAEKPDGDTVECDNKDDIPLINSPTKNDGKQQESSDKPKFVTPLRSPPRKGKPFDMPETPTSASRNRMFMSRASLILQKAKMARSLSPAAKSPHGRGPLPAKPLDPDSVRPGILKSPCVGLGSGEDIVGVKEASPPRSFQPFRLYSPSASPSASILRKRKLGTPAVVDSPSPPNKVPVFRKIC